MVKKSALGRGLSSLIPAEKPKEDERNKYQELDIELIQPNPEQPRKHFDPEKLKELSESIRHNGIIQPVIVTKRAGKYVLIAGERRWRACQLAGYHTIPAIIRTIQEQELLTLSLLENIQRQELNPIEEAMAFKSLIEKDNFTHETLAEKLGKNRATITNTLRLLRLPERVRDMIEDEDLSFGHARCLVAISNEEKLNKLADECLAKGWSVRELEKRIKSEREKKKANDKPTKDVFLKNAEVVLSKSIGTKVSISGNPKKGKVVIPYTSEDELQRIYDWLTNSDEGEA